MPITTSEAFARWEENEKPFVVETYGADDTVALSESWNDYTDSLCKDGELNNLQYHYCPAYDEDMPGDEMDWEIESLLDSLGITFKASKIAERSDNFGNVSPGSRHFQISLKRGDFIMRFEYSQGPAITTDPDVLTVLGCILSDNSGYTGARDFSDWCNDYGYDDDSRTAERIYKALAAQAAELESLITSKQDREDLHELLQEAGY